MWMSVALQARQTHGEIAQESLDGVALGRVGHYGWTILLGASIAVKATVSPCGADSSTTT
jgi:hypothetical protein